MNVHLSFFIINLYFRINKKLLDDIKGTYIATS